MPERDAWYTAADPPPSSVAQALLFTLRTEGPVRRCDAAILPILASAPDRTQCTQEDRLKPVPLKNVFDEWQDPAKFFRRARHVADPAWVRGAVPLLKTVTRRAAVSGSTGIPACAPSRQIRGVAIRWKRWRRWFDAAYKRQTERCRDKRQESTTLVRCYVGTGRNACATHRIARRRVYFMCNFGAPRKSQRAPRAAISHDPR